MKLSPDSHRVLFRKAPCFHDFPEYKKEAAHHHSHCSMTDLPSQQSICYAFVLTRSVMYWCSNSSPVALRPCPVNPALRFTPHLHSLTLLSLDSLSGTTILFPHTRGYSHPSPSPSPARRQTPNQAAGKGIRFQSLGSRHALPQPFLIGIGETPQERHMVSTSGYSFPR